MKRSTYILLIKHANHCLQCSLVARLGRLGRNALCARTTSAVAIRSKPARFGLSRNWGSLTEFLRRTR